MSTTYDPIYCRTIAAEVGLDLGERGHCSQCHDMEPYGEETTVSVTLKDGRDAEVCCYVLKALKERGLVREMTWGQPDDTAMPAE